MRTRHDLSVTLKRILGSKNVYFETPTNTVMQYPAIRYSISDYDEKEADNLKYLRRRAYRLTLIDEDPESPFIEKILDLPMCRFNTTYTSDGLHHYVFTIYI